ncbi:MAG TPA: amidohydrolase family protein [Bryobacteraceae bacterium]|nr:amidohydrolase family protein [Bryobacteraceae bacterium]
MKRRTLLSATFAAALAFRFRLSAANRSNTPIIDAHIHLFDISRPQGVPWPPKDSTIYKTALPDRLRKLAAPHGVVGAIEIECSPWPADNQWVLDIAAKDSFIVGTIGDLEPGSPGFAQQLDALRKNPLFRGIRYGNIWDRDLGKAIAKPEFVQGLKLLASAGLVLDTANPDPALIRAVVRVTDRVPDLKVIIDHLPELAMPQDAAARRACESDFKTLGARPQVFGKISGIVRCVDNRVPLDLPFYRDRLDHIWETFGSQRLMYGSDWPNSDQWADYDSVFRLADEFISTKDRASLENFFWKTSKAAYSWVKRDASQPPL